MTRRTLLAVPAALAAQTADIRTTVRLVLAPVSVHDRKGNPIDGLDPSHFRLSIDGTPSKFQLEYDRQPISLALVVQNSASAGPALAKLQKIGGMIQPLIAGEGGSVSLTLFSDKVVLAQDSTFDAGLVDIALAKARMRGQGGRMLDAVDAAISRLEAGNPKRRRVILLVSEGRDHGSETPVERVMERLQQANVTVYALLYSPFLTAWTVKPGQRVGTECEADSMPALQQGGMDLIPAIVGAASLGKLATAKMLAGFTGGLALSFTKKDALERAAAKAGEDLHSQYLLTFEDSAPADGRIHSIAVAVDTASAIVRSRQAFWRGAH